MKVFIQKFRYSIISILAVMTFLVFWQAGSALSWLNPKFFPSVEVIIATFRGLLHDGYNGVSLYYHLWSSMKRLLIALFFGFFTAVPLGLLSGMNQTINAILNPFIHFYRALPPLAYYTLLVLYFGIGDSSKIVLLALNAFAPLYIATVFSVQQIPKERLNGVRTLGAKGVDLFLSVIFPSCLPEILNGFRTSIGVAYATMVAAEMVAAESGIGWMVLDASKYVRYDVVYVGIIIMGVIAVFIDYIIQKMIKKLSPWNDL